MRVAIVGSGVSGLVAAHTLHPDHDITVLERHAYAGGHAHTVDVQDGDRVLSLDTGFIVFNHHTYPGFTTLLRQLDVPSQPSDMSFAVSCRACRIEYSSRGLSGLFANRSQALHPGFYRMIVDIVRFNRWARRYPESTTRSLETLGDLRRRHAFGPELFRHYLVPMTAAIWSASGNDAESMPLAFLLSFYRNHGLLRTHGHPTWRTVTGGSRRYIEALTRPFLDRVRLSTPVQAIRRPATGVELRTVDGWERFDTVILATHADEALRLLEDPSPDERAALEAIPYRRNEAVLHTDDRVLARAPDARASWNSHVDDCGLLHGPLRMTYALNRLQRLRTPTSYLVTLNDDGRIAPDRVIRRMTYAHPIYSVEGLAARRRLQRLSGRRRTHFCGAYLGQGFHEDGVQAGLAAARQVAGIGDDA